MLRPYYCTPSYLDIPPRQPPPGDPYHFLDQLVVAEPGGGARWQRREVEPDHRQAVRLGAVSENRDRELRTREVRLDQHGLGVALGQEPDALRERPRAVAQVVAEHALAGSLGDGLHEHRKRQRQAVQVVRRLEARERGGGNAAERERLLGAALVQREREGERIGAGVGDA